MHFDSEKGTNCDKLRQIAHALNFSSTLSLDFHAKSMKGVEHRALESGACTTTSSVARRCHLVVNKSVNLSAMLPYNILGIF